MGKLWGDLVGTLPRMACVGVAVLVALATGCGSSQGASGSGTATTQAAAPGTSKTEPSGNTLASDFAAIEAAVTEPSPSGYCKAAQIAFEASDPDSSWDTKFAQAQTVLRSQTPKGAEAEMNKWLERVAKEVPARIAMRGKTEDTVRRRWDVRYTNPLGLSASEQAAAAHNDAWVKMFLLAQCKSDMGVDNVELNGSWQTVQTTPGAHRASDPAINAFADNLASTIAGSGLAAAYAKYGSPACQQLVSDPLVARLLDVFYSAGFSPGSVLQVNADNYGSSHGDLTISNPKSAAAASDPSGSRIDEIRVARNGDAVYLDDARCNSPSPV